MKPPLADIALKILVVEDNDALREANEVFLRAQGHSVIGVSCAEDVSDHAGAFIPDVYLIDLGLPDEDGLSLVGRIRATHPKAGIVITTARTQLNERVTGYRSGADLYMPKPVHPEELSIAIASLGRRLKIDAHDSDTLMLNMTKQELSGPIATVHLTTAESTLLGAFARAPGQSLERWQLHEISGREEGATPTAATIEMRISRLRKKLQLAGAPAPTIKAAHKVGYVVCCTVVVC